MINVGFKLTAKDLKKLADFKHSVAYGTYLKCIKSSPVFVSIMKEHSDKINIESDVVKLKSEGALPENIAPEALTMLFKQSISRMVINIVADTVILKELEDKSVDDVIHEIKDDINILYLTGMADGKYYKEAQKLLEDGKLNRDEVAYRGLMAWMKRQEKTPDINLSPKEELAEVKIAAPSKDTSHQLNVDSNDIDI